MQPLNTCPGQVEAAFVCLATKESFFHWNSGLIIVLQPAHIYCHGNCSLFCYLFWGSINLAYSQRSVEKGVMERQFVSVFAGRLIQKSFCLYFWFHVIKNAFIFYKVKIDLSN